MPVYVVMPKDDLATIEHATVFSSYSAMEQYVLKYARARAALRYDADWCTVIMYDGVDTLEKVFMYWSSPNGCLLNRSPLKS